MTWKLTALTSGGAVVVTAIAALRAPIEPRNVQAVEPQAVNRSGAVVDLGAQADLLRTRLAEVTAYREPARNAFRFEAAPRAVVERPAISATEVPPAVVAPPRPPYGLAGMATTVEDGVEQRTAILSSLQGVSLVKEGEVLDTGYRVLSIADDAVTLESMSDGTQTTLRLSNTNEPR